MGDVYVMRHGETVCNRDGIIQGPRIDSELSDTGHRQAEQLAMAFSQTPVERLYVSPMLRARQTAAPLADALGGMALQVVPELYEMDFGDLCGRRVEEGLPVLTEYDETWSMGFTDRALPGGESPLLVQHRVRGLLASLGRLPGSTAIIAHGRLNRVLLASLMGQPLARMRDYGQSNAAITHVTLGERPHMHRLNDTSHLV